MLDGDSRREPYGPVQELRVIHRNMSDADAATFADQNIEDFASKPSTGWTDWKDLLFRNGSHQNYQLSVSAANDHQVHTSSLYQSGRYHLQTRSGTFHW